MTIAGTTSLSGHDWMPRERFTSLTGLSGAIAESRSYVLTEPAESRWSDQPIVLNVRSAAQAAEIKAALGRLVALTELEPNWDSYGSGRVHARAVATALRLLVATVGQGVTGPSVVPTSDGGVQLEWHEPTTHLELEVLADGSVNVFLELHHGETWDGPLSESSWALERFFSYLTVAHS